MPEKKTSADIFLQEVAVGAQSSLPLEDFLWEARLFNERLPVSPKWRSRMWSFVRLAKGHPALRDFDAMKALETVGEVVRSWKRPEKDVDPWIFWFPSDDPEIEFFDTWGKVKIPVGAGSLAAALAAAERFPIHPAICPSDGYRRFVSLAWHLQIAGDQKAIFLPCERVGYLLGVSAMTVSSYRRAARKAELLRLARKGRYRERRADEFFFNVGLFDQRTGQQIEGTTVNFNQDGQERQDQQDV